jgi:acyl-CoA thioester hydrolase
MVRRYPIDIRWSDLDPYRHVNHATYLSYCESARIAFLDEIGFGMRRLAELDAQIVITGVEARFLVPAVEGMQPVVESEIVDMGRVRSTWRQRIVDGDTELFTVDVHVAFTNLAGRPRRAPEGFVEAAEAAR